ncbi:hypothetical protein BKA60DRAFT_643837 [Fusarium oxysporum]|nr:hypothetical protein BKA60DRAFT_643837 [Fusarium oxysporum]
MADLTLDDYLSFSLRLRRGLVYYDGNEQKLDTVINSVSELRDELTIMRDWTCLANELRRGERKPHRTKRIIEYAKAAFDENSKKYSKEQRKPFKDLQQASLLTNVLVAAAVETKNIAGFSETMVKYILNHGDDFIQRRKLVPYFQYPPFCRALWPNQNKEASAKCWGQQMTDFENACSTKALVESKGKKRKDRFNDVTTEPQTVEGSVVANEVTTEPQTVESSVVPDRMYNIEPFLELRVLIDVKNRHGYKFRAKQISIGFNLTTLQN